MVECEVNIPAYINHSWPLIPDGMKSKNHIFLDSFMGFKFLIHA